MLVALLAGAYLRFVHLGALQMSPDEGATWAAADAPSIHNVIAIQQTHNAGKLPFHDLMLHGWIAIFGDSLFAMRSLSALFGLLTIILMFPLTREVFRIRVAGDLARLPQSEVDLIAALSALITGVSLVTIKYDRELRMYGLLLALAVAHLWWFLRALRRRSMVDYIVLVPLTAALIAVNMITFSMVAVEGIWLFAILARPQIDYQDRIRSVVTTGIAILAGIAILSPTFFVLVQVGREVLAAGKMDWLTGPPWWEPAAFFNKATGSIAFPVLFALAAWGGWRGWQHARGAIAFTFLLMWAPPILLVIGSLLWRPMFMERYAIYSFPAFFIFIALGIVELSNTTARAIAAVAVVILALGHIHSYSLKTHDADWHEAARVAQASLRPGDTMAVVPAFAVEVVRYYLYPPLRDTAVGYDPNTATSTVVILAEHGVNAAASARVRHEYPRVLARERGVVVLSR